MKHHIHTYETASDFVKAYNNGDLVLPYVARIGTGEILFSSNLGNTQGTISVDPILGKGLIGVCKLQ